MKEEQKLIINELTQNLYDLTKWPHYELLFNDIIKVIKNINASNRSALLERCYIYNGFSIFSSLFYEGDLDIFNYVPPNSYEASRQNAQLDRLDFLPHTKSRMKKSNFSINVNNINEILSLKNKYDYIFIPNVLHHYPNPFELFKTCKRTLNKKGRLYIFDATLRENHQQPDDFFRFTADGIRYSLESNGFKVIQVNTSKSPVESLIYTIDQVVQYDLPEGLIKEIRNLNKTIKTKYCSTLKENYTNKVRKYTSFPIAYSVLAELK